MRCAASNLTALSSDPAKAVFDACQLLDRRPELRRRILLLIAEPYSNPGHSDVGPDSALSNTLIYWLNVGHGTGPEDLLSSLTSYTGGRQFALGSQHALERAITQIGEEIHGQYLLSYTPSGSGKDGFHGIRVVATRVGVTVRSRPGWWSMPVTAAYRAVTKGSGQSAERERSK